MMQYFFIFKSHDSYALLDHVCVTILIMIPLFIRIMSCTVTLNYEFGFVAKEIGNVITKLVLPSELESI
ncbi:MAG TPA: hypothetical protein VFU37_18535 [Pyrinomonadaceae bacterium]|nr:hypothetical protein [Pyrinomonadaceae bacterium]